MNVPEINEVKAHLDKLKNEGMISSWELPYENILTRRSAAIFFLSFEGDIDDRVWEALSDYEYFSFRRNKTQLLSTLEFEITFNQEQKEENEKLATAE